MSTLIVGLSYRTAPIALLERAALDPAASRALEASLCRRDHVAEALVVSTCNRLEVYAEVSKFHGGVADVGTCVAEATGVPLGELSDHLYVHYEAAAVAHLFTVACGLDSMAVGEQQIIGQLRAALRGAQQSGAVDGQLGVLWQQALRVGKRAHAETGLDRAGHSLVEAGLREAERALEADGGSLASSRAVVIGAGAMSGLAVATLSRAGVADLAVVNRTPARAVRLAARSGGRAVPLADLPTALETADVVLSCTGAVGHLIGLEQARAAQLSRGGWPQVYVDLALPRDVDPAVDALDGVRLVDLETLGRVLAGEAIGAELAEVEALITREVEAFLTAQRAEAVAPTVVALRALARSVVDGELDRLRGRLGPDADDRTLAEVEQALHRVVEKLLHTPTVRVKERAGEPGGSSYAEVLRELFDLDLGRVATVSELGGPVTRVLRLGTRRSALAMAQSRWVAERIEAAAGLQGQPGQPGQPVRVELVEVTTDGDVSSAPLTSFGGVGVFVSRLREALLRGEIDLAVHSLKDLPTAPAPGLLLAAVPVREDPRDVLVARDGLTLGELPTGSTIGTGSPRRAAQLRALGLGLEIVDVRGNVDTRLAMVGRSVDAVVLARAGLLRLGRGGEATEVLDPLVMLPAPGQGALAVECRADDPDVVAAVVPLDDAATRACVAAEREVLSTLEAGCAAPLGALADVVEGDDGEEIFLRVVASSVDGVVNVRRSTSGPVGQARKLAYTLARELVAELAEPIGVAAPSGPASPASRSSTGEGDL